MTNTQDTVDKYVDAMQYKEFQPQGHFKSERYYSEEHVRTALNAAIEEARGRAYLKGYNAGLADGSDKPLLAIENVRALGIREGRNQILEEWNHDQKKMIDGFSHPKDCEMCLRDNQE